MKFTDFRKLRRAVANIDWNFIAKMMTRLTEKLDGEGLKFEPENVCITEEGIYYINPESGMATKVTLYRPKQRVSFQLLQEKTDGDKGYIKDEVIDELHTYHLTRCNNLTQAEMDGWKREYRIVQRTDNAFPYWLVASALKRRKEVEMQRFLTGQRLRICSHCLVKVNSLLGEEAEFEQKEFLPSDFYDAGLNSTWFKPITATRKRRIMDDIHPRDFKNISRMRMIQTGYICEHCDVDLSSPELHDFLYIEDSDHVGAKLSYLRLCSLCLACKAECSGSEKLKDTDEYTYFLELRERLLSENGSSGTEK